jgi:hypothetical protein
MMEKVTEIINSQFFEMAGDHRAYSLESRDPLK